MARACLGLGEAQRALELATRAVNEYDAIQQRIQEGEPIPTELAKGDATKDFGEAIATRAEIRLALNDFDGAIATTKQCTTGISRAARLAEIYLRRAEHRDAHGDDAGAAEDRQHAETLRQNPFDAPSASP
ncbi:MAG: hypothetical protein H0T47_01975 [Planctomycetaceae bacterium]|nr:hypothetical protein [Planctomycetaceae bacterium]